MELNKELFEHSFKTSIDEVRAYVEEKFIVDVQGKLVLKDPGPDVIIIDHMSLLK